MKTTTLLTLLLLLASSEARVSVKVSPQTFYAGATVTVTCTVPRHADNRKVTAIVDGYTLSERQLDGEQAPKMIRFEFKKVPCDAVGVSCVLEDIYHSAHKASAPIQIAGCEP